MSERERSVALTLVGALVLASLACLAGSLFDSASSHFELRVMEWVADRRTATLTEVARALSTVGSLVVLGPVAALAIAWLVHRGRRRGAVSLAAAAVGAVALSNVVKLIVARPRPSTAHLVTVASYSVPSQHAAQVAAILPALALGLTVRGPARAATLLASAVMVALIGLSRVYLGAHYPSDVLAGWVLGIA